MSPRSAIYAVLMLLASQLAFGATAEHTATLETFAGEVKVLKGGATSVTPTLRMVLRSKDVLYTGKDSSATIVFPDGSAIQLEPKTRFTVQLLEYTHGQRRRSFSLQYGAVVARVSRFFGVGSKASISTPSAVAAARGTGFRLSYDPLIQLTILSVLDGTVEFTRGGVTTLCHAGETLTAKGNHAKRRQGTPQTMGLLAGTLIALALFENQSSTETPSILAPRLAAEAPAEPPAPEPAPPIIPAFEPTPPVIDPEPVVLIPAPEPTIPPQIGSGRSMDWTMPGILGAGVLAAVLSGGGGVRSDAPSLAPVPEPGSLLAMSIAISGLAAGIRRSKLKVGS